HSPCPVRHPASGPRIQARHCRGWGKDGAVDPAGAKPDASLFQRRAPRSNPGGPKAAPAALAAGASAATTRTTTGSRFRDLSRQTFSALGRGSDPGTILGRPLRGELRLGGTSGGLGLRLLEATL